jgi:hypothetical protein
MSLPTCTLFEQQTRTQFSTHSSARPATFQQPRYTALREEHYLLCSFRILYFNINSRQGRPVCIQEKTACHWPFFYSMICLWDSSNSLLQGVSNSTNNADFSLNTMQDQVQYPESPFYSNHNVRKGISNNTLNSLNYYAPKGVFTLFNRRSSMKINLEIYLQIHNQTKQARSKRNCGLLRQYGKNWCLYDPASLSMPRIILQRIHTTHFLAH